eukprot:15407717-Alexandrium_andersonii.AAC.1
MPVSSRLRFPPRLIGTGVPETSSTREPPERSGGRHLSSNPDPHKLMVRVHANHPRLMPRPVQGQASKVNRLLARDVTRRHNK